VLAHAFRCRHDGLAAEADERAGAEGNRPRSGRAAALLGFAMVRRLRDGEAPSPWEAAGAGVGPSRSRHRPPSSWIIGTSPVPQAGRKVARAAEAGAEQQHPRPKWPAAGDPHRRRAASGAVETESGVTGCRAPELDRVQNGHLRIPIHGRRSRRAAPGR
jgi:hypothetical protein